MARAELNLNGLIDELGERIGHFTVENEGGVGVEFFLELMKLAFVALPWAALIHGKNEEVSALVVSECVKHAGMGQAHRPNGGVRCVHGT